MPTNLSVADLLALAQRKRRTIVYWALVAYALQAGVGILVGIASALVVTGVWA